MFMSTKLQRKDVSCDLKIVAFAQLRNLHVFKNLANKKNTSASLNSNKSGSLTSKAALLNSIVICKRQITSTLMCKVTKIVLILNVKIAQNRAI